MDVSLSGGGSCDFNVRIRHGRPPRGTTATTEADQEQLAERAGLSVDVIRKLEQGRRNSPRLSTLNALASALDTEPSHLVGQPTTFEVHA